MPSASLMVHNEQVPTVGRLTDDGDIQGLLRDDKHLLLPVTMLWPEGDKVKKWVDSVWPYVTLLSAASSHAASVGFHYGMLGSFTLAQAKHFNISIHQSSYTGALHLAIFLILSE